MRTLPLTHQERVALFQEWVLPLLIFPARAYFPTDAVISQVSAVYKTALCLTSWGLTLPILELRPGLGGDTLPRPSKFLLWQHATAFMLSRQESTVVPPLSRSHLRTWASTFGVPLEARFLPWLQLGPIPWKTYPFQGMSCKAFSLLRKPAKVLTPPHTQIDAMPLWHSVLFRDTRMNTYYCPALIRKGIHTIAQLRDMDIAAHLPRTWIPVYQSSLVSLAQPSAPLAKEDEGQPAFWLQWNKRTMLRYLMQLSPETPRQTPDTWRAWARLSLPPNDLVFIQTAPWKKLTVGCRLANWQPVDTACPLDRAQETMDHALTECRFVPTAFHLAVQCIGPIPHEGGTVVDPTEVLINTPVLSVTTPLGWSTGRQSEHLGQSGVSISSCS